MCELSSDRLLPLPAGCLYAAAWRPQKDLRNANRMYSISEYILYHLSFRIRPVLRPSPVISGLLPSGRASGWIPVVPARHPAVLGCVLALRVPSLLAGIALTLRIARIRRILAACTLRHLTAVSRISVRRPPARSALVLRIALAISLASGHSVLALRIPLARASSVLPLSLIHISEPTRPY